MQGHAFLTHRLVPVPLTTSTQRQDGLWAQHLAAQAHATGAVAGARDIRESKVLGDYQQETRAAIERENEALKITCARCRDARPGLPRPLALGAAREGAGAPSRDSGPETGGVGEGAKRAMNSKEGCKGWKR